MYGLVLGSALMHATWNALVKSGSDRLLTLVGFKVCNIAVALVALPFFGWPKAESWPYLLASTAAVVAYYVCLLRAYSLSDFNLAYPLARGAAPVLVLILSVLVAGDTISVGPAVGVAVVSGGILILAFRREVSSHHVVAVAWALAVGCFVATYTVIDGIGARLSGDPGGYNAALHILAGIPILGAGLYQRGPEKCVAHLRANWRAALLGGALMFGAYGIVIFALTKLPMGPVAALRESGVIFGALIGALVFKEQLATQRVLAAATVFVGVSIIILWR